MTLRATIVIFACTAACIAPARTDLGGTVEWALPCGLHRPGPTPSPASPDAGSTSDPATLDIATHSPACLQTLAKFLSTAAGMTDTADAATTTHLGRHFAATRTNPGNTEALIDVTLKLSLFLNP